MLRHLCLFVLFLSFFCFRPLRADTEFDLPFASPSAAYWVFFDAPLWDLADEGLPFRFTIAQRGENGRWMERLFVDENRWTFSTGYARVYNSYDEATGRLKNHGGHALLLSAGRQLLWDLPAVFSHWTPRIALEVGINYASRPFPADGTRANFKLITGLEWTWRSRDERTDWVAGVHWPHFSNANLLSRNAGYDGLIFRLGRSIQF